MSIYVTRSIFLSQGLEHMEPQALASEAPGVSLVNYFYFIHHYLIHVSYYVTFVWPNYFQYNGNGVNIAGEISFSHCSPKRVEDLYPL